ncbi:alpha/beta fold hydrolase [Amycolatopsis sp. QT-25]|uniref:thioesterase II family protein n=1 Tax=Amycolatopsis sp. QT-25 TaxID=3034022 RepID=UPI0023EDAEC6|nr:alpha/beta fold hydrolase [Amycolatopsis sp. QT-25]WET81656.1 alpha/beta fold hydrolase [Amycolatopsis sp. QT-25]
MKADFADWFACPPATVPGEGKLLCFPAAASGPRTYRGWSAALGPRIEVRPVRLPGRETRLRERGYTSFPPLIDSLAAAVGPPDGRPLALFGHSLGALVAFELAHRLHRDEHTVIRLVVAASPPPHSAETPTAVPPGPAELLRHLRALGTIPRSVFGDPDALRLILPSAAADFALAGSYAYERRTPLRCPILVLGGRQDDHVTLSTLALWESETTARCTVRLLPGDHSFPDQSAHHVLRELATTLGADLDAFAADRSSLG